MKDKNILELLEILKEHVEDKGRVISGLCNEAEKCMMDEQMNWDECCSVKKYLAKFMPQDYRHVFSRGIYGWQKGLIKPRLAFLAERIEIEKELIKQTK